MSGRRVRVLVVDDSALVRAVLTQGLALDPEIEVVGSASDPFVARDRIVQLRPDVLTLDVEMPRMDGVEFLRRLMPQHPLPVLMVSALTERGAQITMEALEAGAVDFVTKPAADVQRGLGEMLAELREKVKAVSRADVSRWKTGAAQPRPRPAATRALAVTTDKIIAVGASTGGTQAVRDLMSGFPADMPGTVIVQHMPPGFTRLFAQNLDLVCAMTVREAREGDRLIPGLALVAPGDQHLRVVRSGGTYLVKLDSGEKVNGHRPSVDVLFQSVARDVGANATGVILTGMGGDGAKGLLEMRQAGARTLGQDERSSIVYGMPKVAAELGAVEQQGNPAALGDRLVSFFEKRP
ncbi:MAG: chemotaxis response regulator protein-glutamate methylesterase [Candidatus Delongbacteria bacterium]